MADQNAWGSNSSGKLERIESELESEGFDAKADTNLGIVKVRDPSDTEKMFDLAYGVDSGIEIAMTASTVFQIQL